MTAARDADCKVLFASASLADKVCRYAESHSTPLPRHIAAYHAAVSSRRPDAFMLSVGHQAQLYAFLARALGAKRVLEIGSYVGYSAMVWAHAVGPHGFVTGLELCPAMADEARRELCANDVSNVDIVVGDAAHTLAELPADQPYDLVLIDADKIGYPAYLRQMLARSRPGEAKRLLRPGCVIVVDNVLRWGHVADASLDTNYWSSGEAKERELDALGRLNDMCVSDPRLEVCMLPLWDGVSLVRLLD
ncbi:hypothetical protein CDD83_5639 [Cordyceps sp. RAO-2017]|nr:hypothetical protein CDD83_5639 [Cordyceps sp. RAO-2017]